MHQGFYDKEPQKCNQMKPLHRDLCVILNSKSILCATTEVHCAIKLVQKARKSGIK